VSDDMILCDLCDHFGFLNVSNVKGIHAEGNEQWFCPQYTLASSTLNNELLLWNTVLNTLLAKSSTPFFLFEFILRSHCSWTLATSSKTLISQIKTTNQYQFSFNNHQ
jgi:hypothetical protein